MSVSILVVDDEPDVAEMFRQRFRREARQGTYVLHFAYSGEEALEKIAAGIEPQLLHMLRRDTIIIGGGATNRGVETSVREAFNLDVASVVVRECCWSGDPAAHAYSLDKAMKMYARIRSLDQVAAMLRE